MCICKYARQYSVVTFLAGVSIFIVVTSRDIPVTASLKGQIMLLTDQATIQQCSKRVPKVFPASQDGLRTYRGTYKHKSYVIRCINSSSNSLRLVRNTVHTTKRSRHHHQTSKCSYAPRQRGLAACLSFPWFAGVKLITTCSCTPNFGMVSSLCNCSIIFVSLAVKGLLSPTSKLNDLFEITFRYCETIVKILSHDSIIRGFVFSFLNFFFNIWNSNIFYIFYYSMFYTEIPENV